MSESSFPFGGHSWDSRFRASERVITKENVALHMATQAGGLMGQTNTNTAAASRMPTQMGMKYCISGDVLLNSKRVESPNPVSTSARDGIRYVCIDFDMEFISTNLNF
jgi:hypothetical protein